MEILVGLLEAVFDGVGDGVLRGLGALLVPDRISGRALITAWLAIAAAVNGGSVWLTRHPVSLWWQRLAMLGGVALVLYGVVLTIVWWMCRGEARTLARVAKRR